MVLHPVGANAASSLRAPASSRAADPRSNPETRRRLGFHSLLGVPLLGPDTQPLGLIYLGNSRRPGGFSERDERLLTAIPNKN